MDEEWAMGLVTCRECGTAFASDAFVCPHCKAWRGEAGTGAHPNNEPANRILQIVAIALMAVTLVCTVGLMLLWNSTPLPPARPPETSRPSAEDLSRTDMLAPTGQAEAPGRSLAHAPAANKPSP